MESVRSMMPRTKTLKKGAAGLMLVASIIAVVMIIYTSVTKPTVKAKAPPPTETPESAAVQADRRRVSRRGLNMRKLIPKIAF